MIVPTAVSFARIPFNKTKLSNSFVANGQVHYYHVWRRQVLLNIRSSVNILLA
jgi:hypothetical protein